MATTTVDLGPLVQVVVSFLGVVMPLIAGYIAWLIKQRMNIQQDSADAMKIDTAAKRAGGVALDFINKVMPVNPTVDVRDAAVAQGLNHVMASLPDAIGRLGVTPDTLARMVNSELVQLEAQTPTQPPVVTPAAEKSAAPIVVASPSAPVTALVSRPLSTAPAPPTPPPQLVS